VVLRFFPGNWRFYWDYSDRPFLGQYNNHRGIPDVHNDNIPLIYELELSIDFKVVDLAHGGRISNEIS